MRMYGWNDCPEQYRNQLDVLKERLVEHLGRNLAGIYIHGSLALDSFRPNVSDLDVIALLNEDIEVDLRFELVKVLLAISNQPAPLEISLVTKNAIWPWKYPTPFQLHSSEYWRTRYEEQVQKGNKSFWSETPTDSDLACHIRLINRKGICLYGTPIKEAFPDVPERDFRSSILGDVQYAANALSTQPVYGILTLCRILSYLETGDIFSKAQAGEWALPLLPEQLRTIVVNAVHAYAGDGERNVQFVDKDLERFKNLMLSAIHGDQ
ncbi:aminoglycoside adenylyltransferase domain-containing protein [Paenibacillus tarimensis]